MQEADDLILVGIGSILNERRLKPHYSCGKRVVIFGTGAGYCAVPRKIDGLYIKAVRGPLTAAAIGPCPKPRLPMVQRCSLWLQDYAWNGKRWTRFCSSRTTVL